MARGSCWTCRLRRKKCGREQPKCETCSVLNIQCYYSKNRPEWMDGAAKQDEMAQSLRTQVKQGKERRRKRGYVQVLNIGVDTQSDPAVDASLQHKESGPSPVETSAQLFKDFDLDFTMLYVDHVFPFLFPFYAPSMIQGGRTWLLDNLRNQTLFQAIMGLSAYFFTLVLSSEDILDHEACRRNSWTRLEVHTNAAIKSLRTDVLALDEQISATLLQKARAMEGITTLMILETAMARTAELSLHQAAAISLVEDILESSKLDGTINMSRIDSALEKPSWAHLLTDRPIWNTDQAAFRFFLAILLWTDIVSSTSLRTAPRLRKHYAHLMCYGDNTATTLLRMEEYVGCESWALIAVAETATLDVWKQQERAKGGWTAQAVASQRDQIHEAIEDGLRGLDHRCSMQETRQRGILHSFYQSSDTNQATQQALATRIWAHAARIYLTVVTRGWQPRHPTIRESVREVLRLLQQVGSPAVLRSSVWPFCVAGCLAEASEEQEFMNLAAASGPLQSFGLVRQSVRILECVWERRCRLSEEWDLADCFRILGAPVLLL